MLNLFSQPNFFLIAGPCVVEGEAVVFEIGRQVKAICDELQIPYVFKASYRKANRSSIKSFTGIGDQNALQLIQAVGKELGVPVTTDIHTDEEAALAAKYVDILQIPAFLCRQSSLLEAAAHTGKYVNIKKGQFMSPEAMQFAVQKVKEAGNDRVMLTDRGTLLDTRIWWLITGAYLPCRVLGYRSSWTVHIHCNNPIKPRV